MPMDILAQYFDMPITSREHMALADDAWMGGELVSVRYYLGRLLKCNLFRRSDAAVEHCLQTWLAQRTSVAGAAIVRGSDRWFIAAAILQFDFEQKTNRRLSQKPREIAAVASYLSNPTIALPELAKLVGTTEKQLLRMPLLSAARTYVRRAQSGGTS